VLLDLKHLLMEAKQKIPPVLGNLESQNDDYLELGGMQGVHTSIHDLTCVDERGCSYCGGLGHRITDCPKLEAIQSKQTSTIGRKDYLASSAPDW